MSSLVHTSLGYVTQCRGEDRWEEEYFDDELEDLDFVYVGHKFDMDSYRIRWVNQAETACGVVRTCTERPAHRIYGTCEWSRRTNGQAFMHGCSRWVRAYLSCAINSNRCMLPAACMDATGGSRHLSTTHFHYSTHASHIRVLVFHFARPRRSRFYPCGSHAETSRQQMEAVGFRKAKDAAAVWIGLRCVGGGGGGCRQQQAGCVRKQRSHLPRLLRSRRIFG